MKFVLRILTYLVATIVNFGLYVLLFLVASGMSPENGLEMMRVKMEQVATDTTSFVPQDQLKQKAQAEIDAANDTISTEMAQLIEQKNQLMSEKTELEKLRNQVQQLLAEKSKAEEDRMYSLAKIYDGMDQEQLAEVFNKMDDAMIICILPKMKPANASLILEYLPPERSALISKMMLEVR